METAKTKAGMKVLMLRSVNLRAVTLCVCGLLFGGLADGAPLLAGYVGFDDTGLGYPAFSIVNLTGDPLCDATTGFVCDAGAFENGELRVRRNGVVTTFILPGPIGAQDQAIVEDNNWDFSGFESAQFIALLVPGPGGSANGAPVSAQILPAVGQPGLTPGDFALIEVRSEIPEPGSAWMLLGGVLALTVIRRWRPLWPMGTAGRVSRMRVR